ncbi:putative transcription factor bHLH family [Helianthus annuus]|nr:putative transcription factor bHLH family [Helianthus annuus]KAJ0573771.1 putative transcription factor bHLH family [Helianthus annuus]KAJ0738106.1 putative transcription factor bHLH family [Helianthus annuus]KAJ0741005.1 putative transcription factor bHLH family [Helianthus annuus]
MENYWDNIHQIDDYSWGGLEETFSGYYDSSSPDGTQSAAASKNIVSERNRRKKLNDRLFALRAVVPNISKMDKASIIKDAIDYIQTLHEQEQMIKLELDELESRKMEPETLDMCQETEVFMSMERSKRIRSDQVFDPSGSWMYPIEILELNVEYVGEKIVLVNLKCSKRRDTIVKLCEVFESLKLNIVTATISAFPERLLNTLFIQAEKEDIDTLKMQIETAISALNHPQPITIHKRPRTLEFFKMEALIKWRLKAQASKYLGLGRP